MKLKDQRYNEAVERNLNAARTFKHKKYSGMGFKEAKICFGIRADDDSFDTQIKAVIK